VYFFVSWNPFYPPFKWMPLAGFRAVQLSPLITVFNGGRSRGEFPEKPLKWAPEPCWSARPPPGRPQIRISSPKSPFSRGRRLPYSKICDANCCFLYCISEDSVIVALSKNEWKTTRTLGFILQRIAHFTVKL